MAKVVSSNTMYKLSAIVCLAYKLTLLLIVRPQGKTGEKIPLVKFPMTFDPRWQQLERKQMTINRLKSYFFVFGLLTTSR